MFSSNCSNDVAPIMLLVTNGLSFTNAKDSVDNEIPSSFESFRYALVAFVACLLLYLENRGNKLRRAFFDAVPLIYFPETVSYTHLTLPTILLV